MFIVFIPGIIIVVMALAIVGTVSKALEVNLMPIMTVFSIVLFGVSVYMSSKAKEDKEETTAVVMILSSVILFFISISTSCTAGDMVSCFWYSC